MLKQNKQTNNKTKQIQQHDWQPNQGPASTECGDDPVSRETLSVLGRWLMKHASRNLQALLVTHSSSFSSEGWNYRIDQSLGRKWERKGPVGKRLFDSEILWRKFLVQIFYKGYSRRVTQKQEKHANTRWALFGDAHGGAPIIGDAIFSPYLLPWYNKID